MQRIISDAVFGVPELELASVVDTAEAALDALLATKPGLVILDLVLRVGSGLEVLKTLKQCSPLSRVIVFTAYDGDQYRTRCLAAGAEHFLSKTRQYPDLVALLKEIGSKFPDAGKETPSGQRP